MAMSLNKAQVIGNVTRDPEMKQIPGGQVVTSFGVATNFTWTDQSGQKQEKPEFHNVVAWRKLAEICGQYLKKGSKVFIEGRIQTRSWEADDGSKRYRTEIVADNMIMLDKKGDAPVVQDIQANHGGISQEPAQPVTNEASVPVSAPAEKAAPAKDEKEIGVEDLPF
jgi:single-strand DNA-binding protein